MKLRPSYSKQMNQRDSYDEAAQFAFEDLDAGIRDEDWEICKQQYWINPETQTRERMKYCCPVCDQYYPFLEDVKNCKLNHELIEV